jgi:hypothetical protein
LISLSCARMSTFDTWPIFTKLIIKKNTPLEAIPMIHFLFPTNGMVETPVSALPVRFGKDM